MLLCALRRTQLLHFLPKGGEGAEIGVAKGEFSQSLLEILQPRRLHLIDPWEHQEREDYVHDGNNADAAEQERRHQSVREKFATEIGAGRVVVHRAYSQDVASQFEDGQLDWVYIDGLHSYVGCRADLHNYMRKVKPTGLILGHDYTNHAVAQQMNFGVVEAVNEFVLDEEYAFVALTQEVFPTYLLAMSQDLPVIQALTANLVTHVPGVVEMRDYPATGVFMHKIVQIGDQHRSLISF